MNFAGKGLPTEGVKLSGSADALCVVSGGEDCKGIAFWRRPQVAGAEGARRYTANLSGKRTEKRYSHYCGGLSLLSFILCCG